MLLTRRSARAGNVGDQSSKGSNARGASQERKSGGKIVASSSAASSTASSASGKQSQTKGSTTSTSGGNWRGRRSGWEARFLFKDPEAAGDAAVAQEPESEKDTRTTVMIRNIPNKYRYPCFSPQIIATMLYFMGAAFLELQFC